MKLGVLSAWDHHQTSVAGMTQPILKAYCRKHGYELISEQREPKNGMTSIWFKIVMLDEFIDRFDVVVWLDADCLIMDPLITLESFLDPDHDFFIACDPLGLNTGVMMLRNCKWVKDFLKKLLEHALYWIGFHSLSEQTATCYLLYTTGHLDRAKIFIGPADPINSYQPGKFIFHPMGLDLKEKRRVLVAAKQPKRAKYAARWPIVSYLLPKCSGY
jgi:hypothetical protein